MTVHIEHDPDKQQFIAVIEGKLATLSYRMLPAQKTMDYYSIFVPTELRKRHIGQDLSKYALDYAIKNDYTVIPSCPFVKLYIDRHPKYQKLLQK